MPGWELYGAEEQEALNNLFYEQNGIVFAHGFDAQRNGHYKVREFEAEFATHMGVAHAQAVSSGSAAVKIALQAAGVQAGDEVITSCFTFIATVEAILECNAIPVLVDIDETLNMTVEAVDAARTSKTKAIILVHMMGECCYMSNLESVGVVEDACQAIGASYKGRPAGTMGLLGCYSFDGGKTLTTGEGGMVVTNDHHLWATARCYHDHGHCYDDVPRGRDRGAVRGFNHRMTEMQAAVGIAQLRKLDFMITRQRANKRKLVELLAPMLERWPLRVGADRAGDAADTLAWFCDTRDQAAALVGRMMDHHGIGTKNLPDALDWHFAERWPHCITDHIRGHNNGTGWPVARALLKRAIAIPIMINWTQEDIISLAHKLLRAAEAIE